MLIYMVFALFLDSSYVSAVLTTSHNLNTAAKAKGASHAKRRSKNKVDDDDDDDESASAEASLHATQQETLKQALLASNSAVVAKQGELANASDDHDDDQSDNDDDDDEESGSGDDDDDDDGEYDESSDSDDNKDAVASKWTAHENTPELEAIRLRIAELNILIADIKNQEAFHKKVDEDVKQVSTETETQALGPFLGAMWKEMRMFASPFYLQHLEEEKAALQEREKKLRGEAHPCIDKQKEPKIVQQPEPIKAAGVSMVPGTLVIASVVVAFFRL